MVTSMQIRKQLTCECSPCDARGENIFRCMPSGPRFTDRGNGGDPTGANCEASPNGPGQLAGKAGRNLEHSAQGAHPSQGWSRKQRRENHSHKKDKSQK